jgi:hypothetical protein
MTPSGRPLLASRGSPPVSTFINLSYAIFVVVVGSHHGATRVTSSRPAGGFPCASCLPWSSGLPAVVERSQGAAGPAPPLRAWTLLLSSAWARWAASNATGEPPPSWCSAGELPPLRQLFLPPMNVLEVRERPDQIPLFWFPVDVSVWPFVWPQSNQ